MVDTVYKEAKASPIDVGKADADSGMAQGHVSSRGLP